MFYFYMCFLFGVVLAEDGPTVNTYQGQVQGAVATDGKYYVFYGVPYGGPTSGINRFKPPTPPENYPGIFHATDKSIVCAHPSPKGIIGVEDCLVLNIHTNNVNKPKPVMVVLLGDDYARADPHTYSYRRLVKSDIVVVTMNYRLSVFGFLCLGIPEAQGNAGLKDVMQGLKWIKDNIAGFGGNPDNIVLFGHGSGAAMADLITLSSSSSNLVHKAIIQSGSALAPWAVAYEPVKYARALAKKLNFLNDNFEELAKKVLSTNVNLLSSTIMDFEFTNNSVLFAPCLENPQLNNVFLTKAPIDIIRSGKYTHIPVLTGYTDLEGTVRWQASQKDWQQRLQQNFTNFVQVDLAFDSLEKKTAIANETKMFYFKSEFTLQNYLRYQGETTILVPVIRGAKERALTSKDSVWLMEFTYSGIRYHDTLYHKGIDGVRHGDLLHYLFDSDVKPVEKHARAALMKHYVSFINTGKPIRNASIDILWNPVSSNITYLNIYGGSSYSLFHFGERVLTDPHEKSMSFWNKLYDQFYTAPSPDTADKLLSVPFILILAQFVTKLL